MLDSGSNKERVTMSKVPIVPLLLVVVTSCTSCSSHNQRREIAGREKAENIRQQILQMSSKHGADLSWLTILDKREFFTLELQHALLEPPGRPRLLLAPVVDVLKREDAYFITAHDWVADVYFQLQCDAQQAQYVVGHSTNDFRAFDEYAIVMDPKSVHRPVAQLAGEIDVDYAYVIHDAAEIVVVKGVCLDILSLGDSGLNVESLVTADPEGKR